MCFLTSLLILGFIINPLYMKFCQVFLLTVSIFIPLFSYSQILRVDKADLDVDSANFFQGSLNINFNINNKSSNDNTQNATFIGFDSEGDIVYFSDHHAYILINTFEYFSISDGPFVSTGNAHFRTNFRRKKPLSIEAFTQIQYDAGRNLEVRYLLGTGLKYRIYNKKKFQMYAGTGIMWEKERWKSSLAENGNITKELLKSTNYINLKFEINDKVDFNNTIYYQGGYDEEDDVFRNRVSLDLNIKVKLTQGLSFITKFSGQFEDKPIIPINRYVYSLTNGIEFDF